MQDQAFLGPESGLAVPDGEGGVDLYIATQWLHVDQGQVAESLGLPPEKVRLTLGGVGGAFGGREDLSMQVHACMLALHTGAAGEDGLQPRGVLLRPRPPPPVHDALRARRHPRRAPRLRARADRARRRRLRLELDRRRAPTRPASPAAPTTCPTRASTRYVAYTNNPPCGAMRGFGAVQVAFAHEAQMDRLAAALGHGPGRAAHPQRDDAPAARMPTGQVVAEPAPVAELLERAARDAAAARRAQRRDLRELPGGVSNTTHGEGVRARRRLRRSGSRTSASRRASTTTPPPACACRWTAASRSSRSTPPPPRWARGWSPCWRRSPAPSSGSSGSRCSTRTPRSARPGRRSASRQTYVTGGAVKAACEAVRERLERAGRRARRSTTDAPPRCSLAARRSRRRSSGATAPTHRARRGRPGRRARAVRLLGPPRGGRRRHRAGARARGRAGHRPGGGQGHEPPGARGPDRGRHRPGPGPGAAGGDPDRATARSSTPPSPTTCCRRSSTCRPMRIEVLEHADPRGAVRPEGRRRAAQHLHAARHRRGAARRHRPRAAAHPGAPASTCVGARREPGGLRRALRRDLRGLAVGRAGARSARARSRASTTCTRPWWPPCARRRASASSS